MIDANQFPSSAEPKPSRWQRFWAFPVTKIALYLLLFAAVAGTLSALLSGVLHLIHYRRGAVSQMLFIAAEAVTASSALFAAWVMVRADKRPWATAGFNLNALPAGLLGGFAVGAAMLTASVGILAGLGMYHVTAVVPSVLVLVPLVLYFCVALFEETLFRGYIFQTLERSRGSGVALGVTSLLFGLAHLGNPTPGISPLQHFAGPLLICLEAGLPLGAAYLLTRNLWLSIGIHWAWDYFEGPIYGCPDSGIHDPHTLLRAALSGPSAVTGGPFGPEAGMVFLLVGTIAGILLLRAAIQRGQWQPRPRRPVSAS